MFWCGYGNNIEILCQTFEQFVIFFLRVVTFHFFWSLWATLNHQASDWVKPIGPRAVFLCIIYMNMYSDGRAPVQMTNLTHFNRENPRQGLRSNDNNSHLLRVPIGRSRITQNSFCCKGPLTWNELPHELKNINVKKHF